jgi:hypothetical protein
MPWVKISDACGELGLSRRTIWRRIADGSLKSRIEDGLRLVLIGSDEKDESKANPEQKQGVNILSLLEGLYELKIWIGDKYRESKFLSRLFSNIPDGEVIQQQTAIWGKILAIVSDWYQKIQRNKLKDEDFRLLFADLLLMRKEIEQLQKQRVEEMEEEEGEDEDLKMAIKQSKIEMERVADLFEEALSNVKSLLIVLQDAP